MSPKKKVSNKAASVRAMLFKHATEKHFDFNNVLVRYVNERIIYRLSVSPFSNEFILKGGTLISAWLNEPHRPTKDVDLLGKNSKDPEHIKTVFQAILYIDHDFDSPTPFSKRPAFATNQPIKCPQL